MPRKMNDHSVVEIGGDLYTIGGGSGSGYHSEIQRLSCSSRVCTWTTINQQLKVGRYFTVAIPVMDALCTTNCPGDTVKNGSDKCNCPGQTVNDGANNCACPGFTVNDGSNNCIKISK